MLETQVMLQFKASRILNEFSISDFLDFLDEVIAAGDFWDTLSIFSAPSIPRADLTEDHLNRICALIRRCSMRDAMPTASTTHHQSRQKHASVSERDLLDKIGAIRSAFAVYDSCEQDGRFWPFIDAYVLDAPLREIFDGDNPFDHVATVFRSHFEYRSNPQRSACPRQFWEALLGLLQAGAPSEVAAYDQALLIETIHMVLDEKHSLGLNAWRAFLGANTASTNTFLEKCPNQEGQPPAICVFNLLFDIGKPGVSLVPPLHTGEEDSIEQRIGRLFRSDDSIEPIAESLSPSVRDVVSSSSYVSKTIEFRNFVSHMPQPMSNGESQSGDLYWQIARNIADIAVHLSECFPGSPTDLAKLQTELQCEYDQSIYPERRTIGLEAAMMSSGYSYASAMNSDNSVDNRVENGLIVTHALRRDGWIQASNEFFGYLLVTHSLFSEDLSLDVRRLYSAELAAHPDMHSNRIVFTALKQLATDHQNDITSLTKTQLWAKQFLSKTPHSSKVSLLRPRFETKDDEHLEAALERDVGGSELWKRLEKWSQDQLVKAERIWSQSWQYVGKQKEWGAESGIYFMALERELKRWFEFLSTDEEIRQICVQRNVKMEKNHLTAGPIIFALQKLPELPKAVSDAVLSRGFDIHSLPPLMKKLNKVLPLRNQAFHASDFPITRLIEMRTALFSGGLLKEFVSCLPSSEKTS